MTDYRKGAYEMHVHTSPDVIGRKCSDLELVRRMAAAGMRGLVIKAHYADTAARAGLMQEAVPSIRVAGGIVLNRQAGGLNPDAVERSAQMGGRYVWFPTMEALAYQQFCHRGEDNVDLCRNISLMDEEGNLVPEAISVLEVAARYKLLVGTGHVSAREGMLLVREGARLGCRIILTHADNPANQFTLEEQVEAVRQGAFCEHCFYTAYYQKTPIAEIARQIRATGIENVILSTDFGQINSPYADEGIQLYGEALAAQGFSDEELHVMFCETPARLLG